LTTLPEVALRMGTVALSFDYGIDFIDAVSVSSESGKRNSEGVSSWRQARIAARLPSRKAGIDAATQQKSITFSRRARISLFG
jgi:hypothetical protein